MDVEFADPSRRGRMVVVLGVVLAIVAGGIAFYALSQAREQVQQTGVVRERAVVAARDIPGRKAIESADLAVVDVPIDAVTAKGVFLDPNDVVGLVTSVPILAGQPVYANMLAGSDPGGQFSILGPDETVGPDTPAWRAVAITVPDDRAVGGLVEPGRAVDIVVTAQLTVPADLVAAGRYYADRSTKLVYQNMIVLAKVDSTYVIRCTVDVAEELGHLQASGVAGFTLLERPDQDLRSIDASVLGTTTNRIIARYGLPVPEVYPPGSGPLPSPSATPAPTPTPSPTPAATAPPGATATPTPGTDQP